MEFRGRRQGLENNSTSCAAIARAENTNIPWADGTGEGHQGKQYLWKKDEMCGDSQLLELRP